MSELIKKFERDIIKTYRKEIWSKFIKGIQKYSMIEEGDKIAIAMSGGKDSLLLAKLFQELQKHPLKKFEIEFISMDPGYSKENLDLHFANAKKLGVPLNISESNIFKIVEKISNDYPCYMCARMRRGFLYNMAKEKGCNKLALGHHFDDVIETSLLNMFYAGSISTMLPKLKSDNFEGLELIRPMYLVKEWTTIFAPYLMGFNKLGVATVLSTINGILLSFAILAIASISNTSNLGFPKDSIKIALVFS